MKVKLHFIRTVLIFVLGVGVLASCQKDQQIFEQEESKGDLLEDIGLNRDSELLTANDAMTVASIYFRNQPKTRSEAIKAIKNIVPVEDENSQTLFYGVNFEDGYILVPANKYSYPILAEVENGYFDGEKTGTGVDVVIDEIIFGIKTANDNPALRVNRSVWNTYEKTASKGFPQKTRSGLDDVLYDLTYNLGADGWTVYTLANQPNSMPDELYEDFCDAAYNENGDDPYYDYMYYTFIAEKSFQNSTTKGPLLTTSWGQGNPYYLYSYVPLGCTTIATGQLMRYYEYPHYSDSFQFNLSNMPNTISSYDANLCGFLSELKYQIGVYSNGSSNISNVENVLDHYGYLYSSINHSASEVYSSVYYNRPVLMFGEDASTGYGHAWVCDGYRVYNTYDQYRLYVFRYENGVPSYYDLELEESANLNNFVLYRMNWGWNGDNDGYYSDTNLLVNLNNNQYNLVSDREDILIMNPNL